MTKIIQVENGDSGLLSRSKINNAMSGVSIDTTLQGDGNTATPLGLSPAIVSLIANALQEVNSSSDFVGLGTIASELELSPAILAIINGALQQVNSDASLEGLGTSGSALSVVYGSEGQYAESEVVSSTTSTASTANNITIGTFPEQYLTITTGALQASRVYELTWEYTWSCNSGSQDFCARVNRSSGAQLFGFHRQEPKDVGGTGGDTPPGTGTNQRQKASGRKRFTGLTGVQTFDLEFATGQAGIISSIIDGSIKFERIS